MAQHYFLITLDLKYEWFDNAGKGNIINMKYIYKLMNEKGMEKDIKQWRYHGYYTIV